MIEFSDGNYGYAALYKNLLLAIAEDTHKAFIDEMIEAMEEEPYSYDESLKQNFIKLQQAYVDMLTLLISIGEQLRELALDSEVIDYEKSVKQVIDFLLEKRVLYKTVIYKEKGRVIKESVVTLGKASQFDNEYFRHMKLVL